MGRELPTGIFRTPHGFQVKVWTPDPADPNGRIRSKRFTPDTPIAAMKQWREDQRTDARRHPAALIRFTGFAKDAGIYLQAVRAMPTFQQRAKHIGEWIALFGDRPRSLITPAEIRAQRNQWLLKGPRMKQLRGQDGKVRWTPVMEPLSPSAVNDRLRALENLWTVLDGPHAKNPVREVPECQEPEPLPKGQTFALALEVLAHMPDVTSPKKGEAREAGSRARARFAAMLWTGLTPKQIGELKPEHVDWQAGTLLAPRRQKGRQGSRGRSTRNARPRPLLAPAIQALRHLFAVGGNTPFRGGSYARSVRAAVAQANRLRATKKLPPLDVTITPYAWTRHTFGTEVYRASKDLKATQELMGHSDISMTARYAMAAVKENAQRAILELAKVAGRAAKPSR